MNRAGENKPEPRHLPGRATLAIIQHLTESAGRHEGAGWRSRPDRDALDALIRHALDRNDGHLLDEKGKLHSVAIGCNALFLIEKDLDIDTQDLAAMQ